VLIRARSQRVGWQCGAPQNPVRGQRRARDTSRGRGVRRDGRAPPNPPARVIGSRRGASSHCAHGVGGDALREYLDWRPFEYFTCRFTPLANGPELLPPAVETYEFTPIDDDACTIHWRVRVQDRSESTLAGFEGLRTAARKLAESQDWELPLRRALEEDAIAFGFDPPSVSG
jgi:hypothetical protein